MAAALKESLMPLSAAELYRFNSMVLQVMQAVLPIVESAHSRLPALPFKTS